MGSWWEVLHGATLCFAPTSGEMELRLEKVMESDTFLRICWLKEELKNSAELWFNNHSWQMKHLTNFSNKLRRNGFAYNTMKIDKSANEYEDEEDYYSKTKD